MGLQCRPVRRQTGARGEAGEHRPEIGRVDLAGQPERGDPTTGPVARRLTRARVVLLQSARHLLQVVGLGTDSEFPNSLHIETCL